MQSDNGRSPGDLDLKIVAAMLVIAVALFHLGLALGGRGLARDQHLGTALEYAKGRIDLLHPIILGANANDVPTPLEFPLWQALTAAAMKLFGPWRGWGNVVSLLFHFSTLWPIFHLGRGLFSTRAGWWAVVFYLAQPLTFLWGGMAGVDGMSGTLAIWFTFLCWRMITARSWKWWAVTAAAGCLSATTKAPFFFTVGLALFLWLLHERERSAPAWLQLISVGVFSVVAFLGWNHYTNRCYDAAEMAFVDLRIGKDTPILMWWFGDMAARLHLRSWVRGAWRASTILLGSIGFIVLPLVGCFLKGTGLLRVWMISGLLAVGVFTSLVLIHWHYYYIFSAPVALLCARAAEELEPGLWRVMAFRLWSRVAVVGLAVAFALGQGLQAVHLNLFLDRYPKTCGQIIREHTAPTDKLVVWGGGWSTPLLDAERRGVSIFDFEPITNSNKRARLRQLGYNKLVLVNNSPLLVAINTASGGSAFTTRDLPKELPPVAQPWPVRFQSPAVLIVDLGE